MSSKQQKMDYVVMNITGKLYTSSVVPHIYQFIDRPVTIPFRQLNWFKHGNGDRVLKQEPCDFMVC